MENELTQFIVQLIQSQHGWFLPVLVDIVNTHIKNSRVRFLIATFASIIVASALNFDELFTIESIADAGMFAGTVSLLFAQAQISYNLYWKNSDTRKSLFGEPTKKSRLP